MRQPKAAYVDKNGVKMKRPNHIHAVNLKHKPHRSFTWSRKDEGKESRWMNRRRVAGLVEGWEIFKHLSEPLYPFIEEAQRTRDMVTEPSVWQKYQFLAARYKV